MSHLCETKQGKKKAHWHFFPRKAAEDGKSKSNLQKTMYEYRRLHRHQPRNTHSRINMTTRYSNRDPNTHGRADGPSKVYRKPILRGKEVKKQRHFQKVISRNTHSVFGRRDQSISSKGRLTIDTQAKHNEEQYAEELCTRFAEIFPE